MKFTVNAGELDKAIAPLARIKDTNKIMPIRSHILIETGDGELILTATNPSLTMKRKVDAEIIEEGSTTVHAETFKAYTVLQKRDGELTCALNEKTSRLDINGASGVTKLSVLQAADFPVTGPSGDEYQPLMAMTASALGVAFTDVSYAARKGTFGSLLEGVHIICGPVDLVFEAVDGARAAQHVTEWPRQGEDKGTTTVPAVVTDELIKLLPRDDSLVRIDQSGPTIRFRVDATELICRRPSGDFPDIGQLTPDHFVLTAVVPRQGMITALKGASIFPASEFKISTCSIEFDPDTQAITVYSNAQEAGESRESMLGMVEGDPLTIMYQPRLVIQALEHMTEDDVTFRALDEKHPTIITPGTAANIADVPPYQAIVVPMVMK